MPLRRVGVAAAVMVHRGGEKRGVFLRGEGRDVITSTRSVILNPLYQPKLSESR